MERDDATQGDGSLLPGRKPVLEALEAAPERVEHVWVQRGLHGRDLERILDLCRERRVRFKLADRAELDRLAQGVHQGVAARLAACPSLDLDDLLAGARDAPLPLILALDQVQDPGNAGALARSLYALGGAGLVLPRDRSAHLGPAAMKASAGALARLPVARVVNLSRALEACSEAGLHIYCARAGEGAADAFAARLALPAVLVLGNEEKGVRPGVEKRCDGALALPLVREFDSLGVAQAGAMLLALFSRQARERGR
ncbi:MAG: 23S rRNA (guanosine(2251)-2'-O)-methyltransferase RlmB [Thermodesulfobacteriota bacterium]